MTVVTGDNGAGKTSLIEAIGYASTLRSFRGSPREALVRRGAERAVVHLELVDAARRVEIDVELAPGRRDRALFNGRPVTRGEELLESLQVTVFTPDDLELVKGAPEVRREYLDTVLEAGRPRFAAVRRTVERALRQRNTLLRQAGGRLTPEVASTLGVWDEQLSAAGEQLVAGREALVAELAPVAAAAFSRLTRISEPLSLEYRRSYEGELSVALAASHGEDLRRGMTSVGPQRDDLFVAAGGLDARARLSQGQQRSAALALRLAAHEVVTSRRGSRPVLLLDDAFSELDQRSSSALLSELPAGQAILTTAAHLPAGASVARMLRIAAGELV